MTTDEMMMGGLSVKVFVLTSFGQLLADLWEKGK